MIVRKLVSVALDTKDTYDVDAVIAARQAINSILSDVKICNLTSVQTDLLVQVLNEYRKHEVIDDNN